MQVDKSWIDLLHELGTTIGAVAAVIAAVFAGVNHRRIKRVDTSLNGGVGRKKRPKPRSKRRSEDWYTPPHLE